MRDGAAHSRLRARRRAQARSGRMEEINMEIILTAAFGVWIAVTALVYRALTAPKRDKGGDR